MSREGATVEGAMLHTAFMLTVRGTPQLYSGEEIAMEGKEDPDNRRDFPGGFPGDRLSAFVAGQRTPTEQRMWQWTHDWLKLRGEHSALRHGRLIDLFYDDDAYAYARVDSKETVIIVINRSRGEKRISFPAATIGVRDGSQLTSPYGGGPRIVATNKDATLSVPAKTAVAYVVR
jgi:glycosidase